MIDLPTTRRNLRQRLAVHRVDGCMPVPTATLTALFDALDCYSPHVPEDKPDPRMHVLERRLPDWPADDLADLLAELDEAVTL